MRARNRALASGLHERTHLHACSLAQIAFVSHFDGAYVYGGAFEADVAALRAVVRGLEPGARLLVEHVDMLHLARNFTPRANGGPTPSGGRVFVESTWDAAVGRVFERRIHRDVNGVAVVARRTTTWS